MVKTIQNWETTTLKSDSLIYTLNKLFSIRELLESRGYDLKYKAKNDNDFENHMELPRPEFPYFDMRLLIEVNVNHENREGICFLF